MSKVTPRVDIAFKKIFGVEGNEDLLISLINSIVGKDDQITSATLLNPYNERDFQKDKLSILDIKAEGDNGKRFNIEIQISDEGDYDKRALFYWAKTYAQQLQSGNDYSELSKTIGIHILNFTSISGTDKYHNTFQMTEVETGVKYFEDIELHTIELNKFSSDSKEKLTDVVAKVKNALDIWTAFLTKHDLMNPDNLPKELDNPNLKKALQILDVMSFTKDEREAYESHLKWLSMEASTLKKTAETSLAKGIKQGITKTAINLLRQNLLSDSDIATATGFSIDEIKSLRAKL